MTNDGGRGKGKTHHGHGVPTQDPCVVEEGCATMNPRDDEPVADEGGPLWAAGGEGRAVRVAGGLS